MRFSRGTELHLVCLCLVSSLFQPESCSHPSPLAAVAHSSQPPSQPRLDENLGMPDQCPLRGQAEDGCTTPASKVDENLSLSGSPEQLHSSEREDTEELRQSDPSRRTSSSLSSTGSFKSAPAGKDSDGGKPQPPENKPQGPLNDLLITFQKDITKEEMDEFEHDVIEKGGKINHRYDSFILKGFAISIPQSQTSFVSQSQFPKITHVDPDEKVHI